MHFSNYPNVQPVPGFSPSDIWDKLQYPNHSFVSVVVMVLDNYWITCMIAPTVFIQLKETFKFMDCIVDKSQPLT